MSLFIFIALSVWAGLNSYVFWRLGSLPVIAGFLPKWAIWTLAVACWSSLPVSRWLSGFPDLSAGIEVFAMTWLGILFLLFVSLLAVDIVSLNGIFLSAYVVRLRMAAAVLALVFGAIAIFQGNRAPVVNAQEVVLPGLPKERDGLKILFISDLHLGGQIGGAWLHALVGRISALAPDLIAIGGDVVDHDISRVRDMVPALSTLRAPLGVWAVLGNHDFYGGADEAAEIMQAAGFHVLRDESAVPLSGLRFAGVDDLGVRAHSGSVEPALRSALTLVRSEKEGCVLLSHTPIGADEAAKAGAGLMLCGHTHGGQIWPFNFLVQLRYPELVGGFKHGAMTLFISRGAGTWGPRMRLWKPGEVVLITLRAP